MNDAKPAMPERIALLTFCAVPSFNLEIGPFLIARIASQNDPDLRPKQVRLKKDGSRLVPAKDNIEASAPSVAPMRTSHGSDAWRMAGRRKPVVNGRPDTPPFQRWFALALVTGDEEQDTVASDDRALQRAVDRLPGPIEIVSVEVDDPVGLDGSGTQAAIPTAVKRRLPMRDCRPGDGDRGTGCWNAAAEGRRR